MQSNGLARAEKDKKQNLSAPSLLYSDLCLSGFSPLKPYRDLEQITLISLAFISSSIKPSPWPLPSFLCWEQFNIEQLKENRKQERIGGVKGSQKDREGMEGSGWWRLRRKWCKDQMSVFRRKVSYGACEQSQRDLMPPDWGRWCFLPENKAVRPGTS